jgi:membrane protein
MKSLRLIRFFLGHSGFAPILRWFFRFSPPGFGGVSLWRIARYFLGGEQRNSLSLRASSVAFQLMLAFFPTLIFLVSLVPFFPGGQLGFEWFRISEELIPPALFEYVGPIIADVLLKKREGFLWFTLLAGLWLSSAGVKGLIQAFNASAFIAEERRPGQVRWISVLVMLLSSLAFGLVVTVFQTIDFLSGSISWLSGRLGWLFSLGMTWFFVAALFRIAPAKSLGLRFFSAGSWISSLFLLLFTWAFGVYVERFFQYNQVFGVVGAVPMAMIFLYLAALALLIGFDVDAGIARGKASKKK